jgi:hypothetical protein
MMLCLADGRAAQLIRAHQALTALPETDQARLGVITPWKTGPHQLTYRQVEHAHRLIARELAKDEPDGAPSGGLQAACDQLLEASIPRHKNGSSALAADWTDAETWPRPPRHGGTACANPEPTRGHRNSNPGTGSRFFGIHRNGDGIRCFLGRLPLPYRCGALTKRRSNLCHRLSACWMNSKKRRHRSPVSCGGSVTWKGEESDMKLVTSVIVAVVMLLAVEALSFAAPSAGIAASASASASADCGLSVVSAAPFYATASSATVLVTLPAGEKLASNPVATGNARTRVELLLDGVTGWVPSVDLSLISCHQQGRARPASPPACRNKYPASSPFYIFSPGGKPLCVNDRYGDRNIPIRIGSVKDKFGGDYFDSKPTFVGPWAAALAIAKGKRTKAKGRGNYYYAVVVRWPKKNVGAPPVKLYLQVTVLVSLSHSYKGMKLKDGLVLGAVAAGCPVYEVSVLGGIPVYPRHSACPGSDMIGQNFVFVKAGPLV